MNLGSKKQWPDGRTKEETEPNVFIGATSKCRMPILPTVKMSNAYFADRQNVECLFC
jgi:hypothetical protein